MTRIPPAGVFFALFTLSGFAGLIYQSIWSHYLKLFLGHAAYAQTLVLGIFMGGMALGAWLVSRFTGRIRNLLLGYAFAELGIGVLAIGFHRVFIAATGWAYDAVLPGLGGASVDFFKWALASALILPASVLLGTTFPLMSAGIMRLHPGHGGRALSMLYFTNSFGAAIGVLASGFFLIDRFGLPGTILTAGILNVLLALVVWALARRIPVAVPDPVDGAATGAAGGAGRKFALAVLLLAFATGIASFIYEVTWIRMLTLGLGASTHAFEVMIAAFILAMSLGAFWFRNRIQAIRDDVAWLAGLLVAKAVFAAWAVWIYPDVLGFLGWVMQAVARSEGGYTLATLSGMVASMIVMFPTAFCAGMTLPLATHVLTARGFGEASIGRVYGANTAGCIVGAAFATHLGMEALGVKGLTAAGAALDVAVAVLVLWAAADRTRRRAAMASVAVASVAGVALFAAAKMDLVRMSSGVYRDGYFHDPAETRVTFYRDGRTATIAVTEVGGRRAIRTNGKPDASVEFTPGKRAAPDESTMLLAAALPLAMKPDARSIANIGFGSGLTTQALLGSPRVREVDSIEIERMMIEGARLFSPRNDRAYNDPRSHIHIEDAKTFFATRGKRYDIIVSEPSNPWVSGVSTLFSEEFYAHTKRYLAEDGLLVQWVQGYEIDLGLLSTIFAALGKHYSDYAVYRNSLDLLVVATPRGRLPAMRDDIFAFAGLSADLGFLGYRGRHDLEALRVGGRKALEPLFRSTGYPANSDFFPVLDQRAPKARFRAGQITGLVNLRDDFVPVLALLDVDTRSPHDFVPVLALLDVDTRSPHDAAGPPPGNRPPRADQAAGAAEAVAVAMSGLADASRGLAPEARMAATLFHRLAGDCRGASAQWLSALQAVMQAALPFLAAPDLAPLFAKARASACMKSLDELGSRRLALLEAMNAQDALAMAEHATWVLQRLPPQLESERPFLVNAALAGAVASGNRALAQALAAQHVPRLPRRDRESVQVQLLLGHLALR